MSDEWKRSIVPGDLVELKLPRGYDTGEPARIAVFESAEYRGVERVPWGTLATVMGLCLERDDQVHNRLLLDLLLPDGSVVQTAALPWTMVSLTGA